MFETAELGPTVDKETFRKEADRLRTGLLDAQRRLAESNISVAIVIAGVEGSGRTEMVNLLLEWLDARGIEVHALGFPTDEERERPPFWRFWRTLPPKGRIAIYMGSWYTQPIVDRTFKDIKDAAYDEALDRIVAFEQMLALEGVLVLKFWFHLSKQVQRKVIQKLESDPDTSWRVTKQDWEYHKKYGKFRKVCEQMMLKSNSRLAPWTIVDAFDRRHRQLFVARGILEALQARLEEKKDSAKPAVVVPKPKKVNILSQLDFSLALSEKEYEKKLPDYQGRIARQTRRLREENRSLVLVFEGSDAAGKGGAIRRVTQAMDARSWQVIAIAAPTDEERARPYLWRFWRRLPRPGRVTVFDRSWYGRVLVERLEGFCRPEDWQRAFTEINEFEAQMTEFGILMVKFWISISADEQLRRFKEREETPYKKYKITQEDWRNRAKWDAYQAAACEMIERTSSARAPWVLVEGNDKNWARIRVLKTVCETLEKALD